ncbi:MAG: GTP cyclohydrolase I FolE2 [Spirochaetaceae bacterium]|nr:GTP cyclohydrolase I FolE2 [Spirochaetaceae bacterium]
MIDIQKQKDDREIPLMKVGVKNLQYPVHVLDRKNHTQTTSATVDLYVNLPKHFKGTHMSRFVTVFHKYHENLSMRHFLLMLEEIRTTLDAAEAFGTLKFPFYLEKKAPVTGQCGMMAYECIYEGTARQGGKDGAKKTDFFVSISVPVTTLCPCSKAISRNGAHNQRGIVTVKVQNTSFFWIEDIIELVESCASCALYSVLKREDEKFVTEHAYENPRFVEDLVREVYIGLRDFASGDKPHAEKPFSWFSVEAENFESIHNHNAYAYTEYNEES